MGIKQSREKYICLWEGRTGNVSIKSFIVYYWWKCTALLEKPNC
jgi:hypothetical protein